MEEITGTDKLGNLDKTIGWLVSVIGILMVLYHMVNAKSFLMANVQFLNGHLAFSFILVLLVAAKKAKSNLTKSVFIVCAIVTLACCLYVHFDWEGLSKRTWASTNFDLVIGVCLIIIGMLCVKLSIGWFMFFLIAGICIYPFFGRYLPEPFTTRAYPFMQTIGNYCLNLNTGLYSNNLRTSAEYIFLFVVFGSLLSASGVQKFFWELGKILFRKLRSGPGMMAVLNSALIGSVTGSALANVMITGVYTIPAMKKAGYKAEVAGALEAAASSGGQIMPPIMGIVAFIMSAYTGIPYIKIVSMAIVPALLYYLCLGLYAHFTTMRQWAEAGKRELEQDTGFGAVDLRTFFWKMPGFVVPLLVIIVLLTRSMSVMEAAFWAILCLCVVSMLVPKDLRPSIKDLFNGLVSGATEGAGLAVVIIVCGLILITFTGSGIAVKLASGIQRFSGGTTIGVLLIVWAMTILFGMIGVSSVAYYMSAAFAASVLIKYGYTLEVTHFFLMFPCIFSVITPPVALACVVASKLSGGDYIKTAYETVRAAFTAFFLPFLVVFSPAITLAISPASALYWLDIGICFLFVASAQFALVGYMLLHLTWIERGLLTVTFICSFIYLVVRHPIFLVVTLVCVVVFLTSHVYRRRKLDTSQQAAL